MTDFREPPRLREFEPLIEQAIERAHSNRPSPSTVDAMFHAAKLKSMSSAGSTSLLSTSAAFKSVAVKLVTVAVVSSGVWWAVQSPRAVHTDRRPAEPASNATAQAESGPTRMQHGASLAGAFAGSNPAGIAHRAAPSPASVSNRAELAGRRAAQERANVPRRTTRPRPSRMEGDVDATSRHESSARSAGVRSAYAAAAGPSAQPSTPSDTRATPSSVEAVGELELLDRAQQLLRASPERALELTDQHRREYPKGAFAQEREQIAIDALLHAGRMQDVRERIERFLVAFPNSPYAARLKERFPFAR